MKMQIKYVYKISSATYQPEEVRDVSALDIERVLTKGGRIEITGVENDE